MLRQPLADFNWNAIGLTDEDAKMIRALPLFDLAGVMSDVSAYGWEIGRKTLHMAYESCERDGTLLQ